MALKAILYNAINSSLIGEIDIAGRPVVNSVVTYELTDYTVKKLIRPDLKDVATGDHNIRTRVIEVA